MRRQRRTAYLHDYGRGTVASPFWLVPRYGTRGQKEFAKRVRVRPAPRQKRSINSKHHKETDITGGGKIVDDRLPAKSRSFKHVHTTMGFPGCGGDGPDIAAGHACVDSVRSNRATTRKQQNPGLPVLCLREGHHLTDLTDQRGQTTPAGCRGRTSESR